MEEDKTLIALSTAGIGTLVTLLSTVGSPSVLHLWIHIAALFSFFGSIIFALLALGHSADYVKVILKETTVSEKQKKKLKLIDYSAKGFFFFGLLASIILGVLAGVQKLSEGEKHEQQPKTEHISGGRLEKSTRLGGAKPAKHLERVKCEQSRNKPKPTPRQ